MKHILEYKNYERNGLVNRSIPIELPDGVSVMEYIKQAVPWYVENIDNITPIYRGLSGLNHFDDMGDAFPIMKVEPNKHQRYAAYTSNYYIAMMDGSKYWKEYPKRSQSIICTSHFNKAAGYGAVYRVIPLKENSKVAVCPSDDIFFSWNYLFKHLKELGFHFDRKYIRYLNTIIEEIIGTENIPEQENISKELISSHMREFIEYLDELDEYEWDEWENYERNLISGFAKKYINGEVKINDLYEEIEYRMNPKDNGFSLIEYGKDTNINEETEVWTDVECMLVHINHWNPDKL